MRQQGCGGALKADRGARDVTTEYSRGTHPMGPLGGYPSETGTWLLWVRRSTAERPSPLRVCSILSQNALTGSVPSSLSALTELTFLCVPPSSYWCLRVRPRRVGWLGSAPSARHVGGCMSGASSGDGAAAGPVVVVLSKGTSGTRCDYGVLKGHPSYGSAGRVPFGNGHMVAVSAA